MREMRDDKIELKWIEHGMLHKKLIEREPLYSVFEGLAKGFEDDNEISKKLIEDVIPYADIILIDKDHNETQVVPFIVFTKGEDSEVLKIIRYHKIVWAILNRYCTD